MDDKAGLFISDEIADSIDEEQFVDKDPLPKAAPETEPNILVSFKCEESTVTGICERYNIRSLGDFDADFEISLRLLVQTKDVIRFMKDLAKFERIVISVGDTPIIDRDIKNMEVIKMGIEQDLINPGSMISITYL